MLNPKLLYPFAVNSDLSKTRVIDSYNRFSYNDSGKDILDLSLGNAGCFLLGFDRKDIIEYVSSKMSESPFVSGEYMTTNPYVLELTERLYQLSGGYRSIFSLSGSDSLEGAIKIASMVNPERKKIIGFKNSYHGSTFLSSSIGGIDYMTQYWGKYENCCVLDNCDIESIKLEIKDACCLIIETCSWNNGLITYPKEFWKELRKLCTENSVVLIVDDIAMCGGKTGKFFGFDQCAEPDIFCVGKSFSGGYFPLSACLVSEKVSNNVKDKFLAHGFTYSFSLSGIYGTLKYLEVLEKENHFNKFDQVLNESKQVMDLLLSNNTILSYKNYGLVFELKTNPTSEEVFYNNGINIGIWNSTNDTLLLIVPLNADQDYFYKLQTRLQNALLRP